MELITGIIEMVMAAIFLVPYTCIKAAGVIVLAAIAIKAIVWLQDLGEENERL